jgi:hypothetical protein
MSAFLYDGTIKIVAKASTIGAHSIIKTSITDEFGTDNPKSDRSPGKHTGKPRDTNGTAAYHITCN